MKFFDLSNYFERPSAPVPEQGGASYALAVLLLITACGFILRMWGLGDVGLHGDEETMALPVRSIIDMGLPYLPSDMFYSRGLSQLYLMGLSVTLFGETEWALRLPSALIGSLTPLVAWLLGRRFLNTNWALLFAATLTFMPEVVEASQTARFYIFYFLFVMLFAWQVLRWGDSLRYRDLFIAALIFLIGLDYQPLMVFSTAIFAVPMCTNYSSKRFYGGIAGLALCVVAFLLHRAFTEAMYEESTRLGNALAAEQASVAGFEWNYWLIFAAVACLAIVAYSIKLMVSRGAPQALAFLCLAMSIIAAAAGSSSLALVLLAFGAVLHIHLQESTRYPVIAAVLVLALLIFALLSSGPLSVDSVKLFVKNSTTTLSVWPWIVFLKQYPIAAAAHLLMLVPLVFSFTRGQKLPEFAAIYLFCVVLPLTVIGLFIWFPAVRYLFGFVPFFVLATFALLQNWQAKTPKRAVIAAVIGLVACIGFIEPKELRHTFAKGCATISNSCIDVPEHRTQAAYIESLDLSDDAIIIAEDVLQQSYYLGKVDYWLLRMDIAKDYVRNVDGKFLDIYTSTETIMDASAVNALLSKEGRADVYIIGNPENFTDGRAAHLSEDVLAALAKWPSTQIYTSDNGHARIWHYPRHASSSL